MFSSFFSGQRQFKLDLVIDGTKRSADLSDNQWTLNKDYLQGVKTEILKSVFDASTSKSVYKLVLNSVWKQDTKINLENQEIEGALGLVKATWKGSEKKWEAEEVKIEDSTKVWLIMAQGAKGIYLMPVVRSSGSCMYFDVEDRKSEIKLAEEEIGKKGVADIKVWNSKFDGGTRWLEQQDIKLLGLMNSGFSITRTAETAILEGKADGATWRGSESVWVKEGGKMRRYNAKIGKGVNFLYKNAGILGFNGQIEKRTVNCNDVEHYFPLDLVVLGDTSTVKFSGYSYGRDKQTITITDKISEVIGVRLN